VGRRLSARGKAAEPCRCRDVCDGVDRGRSAGRHCAPGADGTRTRNSGVDTEHLFGLTEGTDIGAPQEKEIEVDSTFRFGKRTGYFPSAASEIEFKYTAFENFRISTLATFAYYDIVGVAGMEDRSQAAAQSVSFDARFRLLDRQRSPFGLTLSVEPHWGF